MVLYFTFVVFLIFWNLAPGPNVAMVSQIAIKYGLRGGLGVVLGIVVCDVIYLTLAFLGVSEFIARYERIFYYAKMVGGLYILYVGVMTFLEANKSKGYDQDMVAYNGKSFGKSFVRGFLTDLSNPLTIVGMTSFILQFFNPEMQVIEKFIFILTVPILSFVCYFFVVFIFANKVTMNFISPKIIWFERISGIILAYIAIMILFFNF